MGGEILLKDVQKKMEAEARSRDMKNILESGMSLGKDDARKELEEKVNTWEAEEKKTLSHKLLLDRILKELSELAESWKLKTVSWEEAKAEIARENGEQGSNETMG